jgi:hypothetical protein
MKEPNRTSPYWSLKFQRGTSSTDVDLNAIFAGIASLDLGPKNAWMTLSKCSAYDEPLGFAQTALTVDGFIVEVRIETVNSSNLGFWKAGRKQPRGPLVVESKEGLFQTFSKDLLSMDEVNLIFDYFYHQFMLHAGFKWRSILTDFSQSNPGASALKMAQLRYHLDPWKTAPFICWKCSNEYLGSQLAEGELFDYGIERDCPNCQEPILLLTFETVDELAQHPDALAPGEREAFAERSNFVQRWRGRMLKSPDQLPDLRDDEITLLWDVDSETEEILIRTEDHVIWRQPTAYEHYAYFVDALKILKAKYGRALVDVIPTDRAKNDLWGDRLPAPEICDAARRNLRTN